MSIKYVSKGIVLEEVPDEITLAFSITNCTGTCEGCHSPWLREDIGDDLERDLPDYLKKFDGRITCVAFLGEGNDPDALIRCIKEAHEAGFRTCVYSGKDEEPSYLYSLIAKGILNYLKIGSYKKELGGLDSPTTNQRMFKSKEYNDPIPFEDITHKFQKGIFDE